MSETEVETIVPPLAGRLEASVWEDRDLDAVEAAGYAVAVQLHGRGVATVDYGPGWTLSILAPTKLRHRYLAALEHQGLCFVWKPVEMSESEIGAAMPISGLLGYVERIVLVKVLNSAAIQFNVMLAGRRPR